MKTKELTLQSERNRKRLIEIINSIISIGENSIIYCYSRSSVESYEKKIIESENSINSENKQDTKNNNSNLNTETVYRITTENIKLKIVSQNNKTIGAKVFINDSPAHDGIYVYKALTHKLIIRNGEMR